MTILVEMKETFTGETQMIVSNLEWFDVNGVIREINNQMGEDEDETCQIRAVSKHHYNHQCHVAVTVIEVRVPLTDHVSYYPGTLIISKHHKYKDKPVGEWFTP